MLKRLFSKKNEKECKLNETLSETLSELQKEVERQTAIVEKQIKAIEEIEAILKKLYK